MIEQRKAPASIDVYQDVNVTVGPRIAARDRSDEGQPDDAAIPKRLRFASEYIDHIVVNGRVWHDPTYRLYTKRSRARR